MAIFGFLSIVLASLQRNSTRSIFTFASVVSAFLLFSAFSALRSALSFGLNLEGESLLRTSNAVSIVESLPEHYEQELAAFDNVAAVSGFTWFGGVYKDPSEFFLSLAVDPADFAAMTPGVYIDTADLAEWTEVRSGAIVGRALAERYGWRRGDRISLTTQAHRHRNGSRVWSFVLVGIYRARDKAYSETKFLLRQDYLSATTIGPPMVSWFTARLRDPEMAADTARSIDARFVNSPTPTITQPEGVAVASFVRQFADFGAILNSVAGTIFGITALLGFSAVAESVRERAREFVVFRALGFRPFHVFALVATEALLLIGGGGLLGLCIGAVVVGALEQNVIELLPGLSFRGTELAVGICVAVTLGLLAGVYGWLGVNRSHVYDRQG